jgi:anti-sigma factor RsiW
MKTPSFHDVEQLSAFLDGQLSQADRSRLEIRLQSDPELSTILEELRQARTLLRLTPKRLPPRNFILTKKMAGIKPPVPRSVPILGWASVVAMVLFLFTQGTSLLGRFSLGAAAPMAVAPASNQAYGIGGGPAETQPPAEDGSKTVPTPESMILTAPESTATSAARSAEPPAVPAVKAPPRPVNYWPYIWLGVAGVLISAALLIRQLGIRAFHRKVKTGK